MKPHLIIKVRQSIVSPRRPVPHWQTFIHDKSNEIVSLLPAFDDAMRARALDFWVTREYAPAGPGWTEDEIASGLDRVFRIILQRDAGLPADLVAQVRLIPEFEYVRPIDVQDTPQPEPVRATSVREFQFDRSRERIGLPAAQRFGQGDPRIKVAVLDTGVDIDHPEIAHAIEAQADFVNLDGLDTTEFIGDTMGYDHDASDEVGHGSHVAGIIAGRGLNMPNGVAPRCKILAVRTLASMRGPEGLSGAGIVDNINVAIKWAVDQGAHVINASLGIRHTGGGLPHEEVIAYALRRGVSIVAASGNDGTAEKYYPGALPGVIAVGAGDPQGEVASFSSYGAHVSLIAPGTTIVSCDIDGGYKMASGTSQASPFVAGAVALLRSQALSRGTEIGDRDIKEILVRTTDQPHGAAYTRRRGYGHLNLADACRLLNHVLEARGMRLAA